MSPIPLPVTLTFVSISAAMLLPLTAWIGLYRRKISVLRGDGGDPALFKRTRIHGNFVENAPLFALAMTGAEALGLGAPWLWSSFCAFVVGRILHYMLYDTTARGLGMLLTTLPAFVWGAWILSRIWLGN